MQHINLSDTSKSFLLKLSSDGTIEWQKEINSGRVFYLYYLNHADNGYLITGGTYDTLFQDYLIVIKVDYFGDTLWSSKYREAGTGTFIKQMANGNLLVVGLSSLPGTNKMIMRTDRLGNVIYYNLYSTSLLSGITGISTSDGGVLLYEPKLTL